MSSAGSYSKLVAEMEAEFLASLTKEERAALDLQAECDKAFALAYSSGRMKSGSFSGVLNWEWRGKDETGKDMFFNIVTKEFLA